LDPPHRSTLSTEPPPLSRQTLSGWDSEALPSRAQRPRHNCPGEAYERDFRDSRSFAVSHTSKLSSKFPLFSTQTFETEASSASGSSDRASPSEAAARSRTSAAGIFGAWSSSLVG